MPIHRLVAILPLLIVSFASAAPAAQTPRDDVALLKRRLYDAELQRGRGDDRSAAQYAASLRADGSWADIDYADRAPANWKTSSHLNRLVVMARAYRGSGQLGGSGELRKSILLGLDRWIKNDPQNPNWWHNQIGVPQSMGSLLILMDRELAPAQLDAGIAIMKRSNWARWTGQNLVWGVTIQVVRGCVQNDPDVVAQAFDRMYREIRIANTGQEGIQADFSFHQHGPLLYCGGYGLGFTVDCARFISPANGTRFAAPPDKLKLLESYALDGQQWMVWKDLLDYEVTGRELTRPGKRGAALAPAARQLAALGGARAAELENFAAFVAGEPAGKPVIGNRHFYRSDYMAHRRANWFASIRMYSDRLLNTDGFINGENKKSHHLADGATMLYVSGDEYRDIFPVWDWLRIPGTTVEQNTPLVPRQVSHRGATAFVGGVSDGSFGLAAMHLKTGQLEARKAWFCFDEGMLCLGSGITCASENPVYTSINQSWLSGPVKTSQNAEPMRPGARDIKLAWAWHDAVGYVFPGSPLVHVANQPQTGAWSDIGVGSGQQISRGVFSLWIDHGRKPAAASYAYLIVPAADEKTTAALAKALPAEVLSNTPGLQAAIHKRTGVIAAAFFRPGKLLAAGRTISVDQPCLLLASESGKTLRIPVSNPEGKAVVVNVDIDGARLTFDLPGGVDGGKSVIKETR